MACQPGISSMSLGRAWVHDLPTKFKAASAAGLKGVEIYYEDLEYLAKSMPGGASQENQLKAAHKIRELCDEVSLEIIALQPFMGFEGHRDRAKFTAELERLRFWLQLAKVLKTNLILIPSSTLPADEITDDVETIVADFQAACELGAKEMPGLRFLYEALAWGTYVDTWEKSWDIVKRVDRANFGLLFDTFNICARVYADPTAEDGKTPNADNDIRTSIERIVSEVDVKKVFFIQVVDAERLSKPLIKGHEFYDLQQPPRMSFSRNCRLFYREEDKGAYLPVKDVLKAILVDLGYRGWVSMEYFNRDMTDPSPSSPAEHAKRAMESWNRIVKDCGLEKA